MAGRGKKKEITVLAETYDGSTPLKSLMQEMFIEGIVRGLSQTEAYRRAGYKSKNATNGAIICQSRSKVAARLAYRRGELQAQMQAETGITERAVVEELAKCAFSNMQDFVETDKDGNIVFKDFGELSREQMAAVESVKITKQTTTNKRGDKDYQTTHTQFKLHSKPGTLEQLGKHLGIFREDNGQRNQTIFDILAVVMGERRAKAIESTSIS